jgi:ribonuclease T
MLAKDSTSFSLSERFRGFLPVVVDVETGGFNAKKDALLEIGAVILGMDSKGLLFREETYNCHIEPFKGANLDAEALAFTGIDPYHPFRMAKPEKDALQEIFRAIRKSLKQNNCKRAILVGHNAPFDLGFINAAVQRCEIKRNPFHPFSTFDTVTLGGVVFGQTVLARIAEAAGMQWDHESAHSAIYDAEQTAELFCLMTNRWQKLAQLDDTVPQAFG